MLAYISRSLAAWHHRARRQAAVCLALARGRVAASPSQQPPPTLLLVVIGLIGDSILCTPALAEARRLLPAAVIHVLTTSANEQLFRDSGWADAVHVYDGPAFPLRLAARRALRGVVRTLRLARLDAAVILLGDDFAPLLCRARIARRIGVAGTACDRLLTATYDLGEVRTWGPGTRLNALRCLGLQPRDQQPSLPAALGSFVNLRARLRSLGAQGKPGYVLLHPFGATPNRTLPVAQAAALADQLAARFERQVLLIGGPRDRPQAEAIWTLCRRRSAVRSVAGHLSLSQTVALMEQAGAIISTDSGPLHMAGALARPTVGLFRAIRPEYARLYPTVTPLFWEQGPACLPGCTWDSWYGCTVSPCRQLAGIANSRIVAAVQACLASAATKLLPVLAS